jgi:distribution and morphology protein 31
MGHLVGVGYDVSSHPAYHRVGEDEDGDLGHEIEVEQDTNYAMFDLNVDSIDVTLSLTRWLDGKGLVADAVVKGVRGVLGLFLLLLIYSTTDKLPRPPVDSVGPISFS